MTDASGPAPVKFPHSSLADVAAKLRDLAESVERGELGRVECCAIVALGDDIYVYGFGRDANAAMCASVMTAGANQLIDAIIHSGRTE